MENPLTPAGIESVTLRFVAQHLNHCATAVSLLGEGVGRNYFKGCCGLYFLRVGILLCVGTTKTYYPTIRPSANCTTKTFS